MKFAIRAKGSIQDVESLAAFILKIDSKTSVEIKNLDRYNIIQAEFISDEKEFESIINFDEDLRISMVVIGFSEINNKFRALIIDCKAIIYEANYTMDKAIDLRYVVDGKLDLNLLKNVLGY